MSKVKTHAQNILDYYTKMFHEPSNTLLTIEDALKQIDVIDNTFQSLSSESVKANVNNNENANIESEIKSNIQHLETCLKNCLENCVHDYLTSYLYDYKENRLHDYLQNCGNNITTRLENPHNFELIKTMVESTMNKVDNHDQNKIINLKYDVDCEEEIKMSPLVEHYKRATEYGLNNQIVQANLNSNSSKIMQLSDYVTMFIDNHVFPNYDVTIYDIIQCRDPLLLSYFLEKDKNKNSDCSIISMKILSMLNTLANRCGNIKYGYSNDGHLIVTLENVYNKMFDILLSKGYCHDVFLHMYNITNIELRNHIENRVRECIKHVSNLGSFSMMPDQ